MKPRTCVVRLWIANDAGQDCRYSLRPVPPVELAQSVAAFTVLNLTKDPSPKYTVRLSMDGQAVCDCPQHGIAGECKHADALTAAGILPCGIIAVLQTRTHLLDAAEALLRDVNAKLQAAEADPARVADAAGMTAEKTAHERDADFIAELPSRAGRGQRPCRPLAAGSGRLPRQALAQAPFPEGRRLNRLRLTWRRLWTEAVALASVFLLPAREAARVESWVLRVQARPDAEGDSVASVAACRDALRRLHQELHRRP